MLTCFLSGGWGLEAREIPGRKIVCEAEKEEDKASVREMTSCPPQPAVE